MISSFHFRVFVIPVIALLTPVVMLIWRVYRNKLKLALTKKTMFRFSLVWFILSMIVFTILLYLTSGILTAFRLEKSLTIGNRDIQWNATEHLRVIFVYDPGISLLVISFLSGLLYASLLTLPKVCTLVGKSVNEDDIKTSSGATASISSISSAMSAFATSAVCCSTSVIAVLAPSVALFLGPFVPGLLIFSFILLIYSFRSIVLPRFVIPSTLNNPGFVSL